MICVVQTVAIKCPVFTGTVLDFGNLSQTTNHVSQICHRLLTGLPLVCSSFGDFVRNDALFIAPQYSYNAST